MVVNQEINKAFFPIFSQHIVSLILNTHNLVFFYCIYLEIIVIRVIICTSFDLKKVCENSVLFLVFVYKCYWDHLYEDLKDEYISSEV